MFLGVTSSRSSGDSCWRRQRLRKRDRDRFLGVVLADDMLVERGDDRLGGQVVVHSPTRLNRQPVVGEDADLGGDRHRPAGELFGVLLIVGQRLGRGERIIAARADRGDPAFGLQHVAVAGQDQHRLRVGDDHHRLEVAEIFVGPPVLGQLDRGAHQLAAMLPPASSPAARTR